MHRTPQTTSRLTARGPRSSHGLSQPAFLALLIVVALLAGLGGFGFYHLNQPPPEEQVSEPRLSEPLRAGGNVLGMVRPDFSLPDLDGETRHIREWDGRVVLVNFWATWCPPCLKEMPAFVEMQDTYGEQGLTIVAVAIDDEDAVRDFSVAHGLNFPVLLGDVDGMAITRNYGNRLGALPYSVLLDQEGKIHFIQAGELHKDVFERELQPLL